MTSVFTFLGEFCGLLREAGVRFAITSGMACVRYGLQQTTKDSDWIIDLHKIADLRDILMSMESRMPPAVVTYRPIFGAPLDERWHCGGWTSHLAVRLRPNEIPHHLDFFGRPPRVLTWSTDPSNPDYADRATVTRMKKTDRDRDWPMVDGLASQDVACGGHDGLLHLQSAGILRVAWDRTGVGKRKEAIELRPALRLLDIEPDDLRIEAAIRAERLIWESVNRERYRCYQMEWKAFYRRWQSEPDWHWPTVEPFAAQHARLVAAAQRHELLQDPFSAADARQEAFRRGVARAAILANMNESEMLALAPPLTELLP